MTKPAIRAWDDKLLKSRGHYIIAVTPDIARSMLERNTLNRQPKKLSIPKYARDMAAGAWNPDSSDLRFSNKGDLMDGQNRLLACLIANVSFTTGVLTGLDPDARDHVDTGVKRTSSDMLRMHGVTAYPAAISAAATLWMRYQDRVENYAGKRLANASGGGNSGVQISPTHKEILAFLEAHPLLEKYASMAESLRSQALPAIPPSVTLAFMGMAAEKDEAEAVRFADRLITGQYGSADDPLIALVQYAARIRVAGKTGGGHRGRIAQDSHLQALSRVWNASRGGAPIKGRLHIKVTDRLVMPI